MANAIEEIRFTKVDHLFDVAGRFTHIGAVKFDDPDEAERFWNALPEDDSQNPKTDGSNLLADMWTRDGWEDTKYVTAATIEQHLGTSEPSEAELLASAL